MPNNAHFRMPNKAHITDSKLMSLKLVLALSAPALFAVEGSELDNKRRGTGKLRIDAM